ncbi:hypothetical protein GCM10023194_78110 [Planotetraspora phitsanulokensis]|uniref:Secreted protein n=1 Tax=Planotetraspora phitsanulokensis TaxID=575192 RepID=A0A8J3UCG9_9ACTN|nr:hypothetical protein [Planotetraspora phitsanulokensis]GII41097.1 hypothetical protein Pph01_61000 [Planotetraspora phitsanulokensis]
MRNFTRMGFIAVSATFLSIAAASAASASAQGNPVADGALKMAAQNNPIVAKYVPQLQKEPTNTEKAVGKATDAASEAEDNAAAAGF